MTDDAIGGLSVAREVEFAVVFTVGGLGATGLAKDEYRLQINEFHAKP